ncbi:MAG: MBL fold metallo-hydrolase [Bradymonadia bacterium]
MKRSASIILLDSIEKAPDIFWGERGATAPFLASFYAFPGGLMATDDVVGDDLLESLRRCAVRELREEVGLDLSARLNELAYLGCWRAPQYLVYSMETHYFAMVLPECPLSTSAGDGELQELHWINVEAALDLWRAGQRRLAPPTRLLLEGLAQAGLSGAKDVFLSTEAAGQEPTFSPIEPDVMMLPLKTPTLPPATHTNCYILGREELLVIEPAARTTEYRDYLYHYLDQRVADGAQIKAIITTHHHHDHIGGLDDCRKRYGAPVLAHRRTAELMPVSVDKFIDEGDLIETRCGQSWTVLFTPGHAPGHICLVEKKRGLMVVGDMVAGLGSILIEPNDGDMKAYLESLERMKALAPNCLMPSHGPYIAHAVPKLDEYTRHRLARESSVLKALETASNFLDILEQVYADTPAALKQGQTGGLAGLSLLSHLQKLSKEGVVRCGPKNTWYLNPQQ